jgi:hypothetical protein
MDLRRQREESIIMEQVGQSPEGGKRCRALAGAAVTMFVDVVERTKDSSGLVSMDQVRRLASGARQLRWPVSDN